MMIKKRISLVLIIEGGGYKLPPLVIMKGKKNGYLEKKFNKIKSVIENKIFVKYQENSWCDSEIYLIWWNEIFLYYRYKIIKKDYVLIHDNALSHLYENVNKFITHNSIE